MEKEFDLSEKIGQQSAGEFKSLNINYVKEFVKETIEDFNNVIFTIEDIEIRYMSLKNEKYFVNILSRIMNLLKKLTYDLSKIEKRLLKLENKKSANKSKIPFIA